MELIGEIRSLRAELNIDPKRLLDATFTIPVQQNKDLISENLQKVRSLARLRKVEFSDSASGTLLRGVCRLGEFGLDVHDAINIAAERERLQKELVQLQGEIEKVKQKINSQEFLSRAPEEVIADNRIRFDELIEKSHKIEASLAHLPRQ